jgi:hypothetical protein
MLLTRIRVHPVAQGGIDAKIGAKNMETKKQRPQVMPVKPVFPPSAMPAPDSITVLGREISISHTHYKWDTAYKR